MRARHGFLLGVTALMVICPALEAQDETANPAPPLVLGGFQTQGSATAGYRFTNVKGYQPMYQELFDLNKGFRVQDFNIYGEAVEGSHSFADTWSVLASGLGGDPFPAVQLTVAKTQLYELRINWRQSYYYWNQNDNVTLPTGLVAGFSRGLTSNHDWATVRKFGSADFTVHATNNLRFNFSYYRTSDNGPAYTTRSLDFLSSPSYWGAFARASPYFLYAPLNDETNRFTGGLDYTWKSWNFHYNVGWQTFTENLSLNNFTAPELPINPIASSTKEPLTSLSWSQFRRLTTPISEFSYNGKPSVHSKWEFRGGYIFYRYSGPATLDQSFNGVAPDATGAYTPYSVSQSGRDTVTEPNHIIDQGLSYHVKDWWEVNEDYRYSRFTTDATGLFTSLFNGGAPGSSNVTTVWRDGLSDLDVNMLLTPIPSLVIRPGIHLLKADIESLTNGVADPALTLRTNTVSPELSASYQPSSKFSIRGDVHSFTNGSSYTAITPHTQVGGHLEASYRPTKKLTLDTETRVVTSKLLDTNFQSRIRSSGTTLTYSLDDRFSIFGGFTYDSEFAQGNIVYVRGTPPLNDFLRDQDVNRVIQGGIEARPLRRFGFRISGNYDRTTGLGQISGELPNYGPLRWPLITGTVFYEVPKAGRLSVDLERSYYIEQIVTGNNFSANLLTIRWTRNF